MAVDGCLFVAISTESAVRSGLDRLRRFYQPLGLTKLDLVRPSADVAVGYVRRPGSEQLDAVSGTLAWGEPLPAGLSPLSDATDRELRGIEGMTAAAGWADDTVRVVGSSAGPTTLYEARTDAVHAFSTHAVAAALIAGLDAEVDETAIGEFIAMDFVGGDRTLVASVRAVPPATVITIRGAHAAIDCYWPAAERWALVPEADAYAHAEQALLSSIAGRLDGDSGLALTGGLDSTVAALAMKEVGVAPTTFTWGDADWQDSVQAAATAVACGLRHEVAGFEVRSPKVALAALDLDARWTDGVTALSATNRWWPRDAHAVAVGMGGETGRAFYYSDWSAVLDPRPSDRTLAGALGADGRLAEASDEARARLAGAHAEWIEQARSTGVSDWRVLDVAYAEQRVRRWGRSQVPLLDAAYVPIFTPAELQRALVSMSQAERLTDGFHRRFLRSRGRDVEQPELALADAGALSLRARRALHRLRGRRARHAAQPDPVDSFVRDLWRDLEEATEWLREDALRDPLIERALGAPWAESAARAVEEGRKRMTERALRAAGVVAFSRALGSVRGD